MKRWILIIVAFIFILSITGCQKAPESQIVIGKDNTKMIDTAMDNKERKTIAQMINAPTSMVLSKTDGNGNVAVNADAEIIVPDTDKISAVRIRKHSFTQEEADKILEYFIGDKDFNNRYEAGYDEMVEKLINWKAELAKETDPKKREGLEQSIQKFESAGVIIPDKPSEIEPAPKVFWEHADGGEHIEGYSSDSNGKYFLQIINNSLENVHSILYTKEQDGYTVFRGSYWYERQITKAEEVTGNKLQAIAQAGISISKDEAKQTAINALADLGIDDMVLATCEKVLGTTRIEGGITDTQGRCAYQLRFVRSVNGVPITYTDNGVTEGMYKHDENDDKFIVGWANESIEFIIDDTGIVEFCWKSPYSGLETIADSSALKSFDDIQAIFSKMILVTNAQPDPNVSLEYNINKVQLGLMRIKEKENDETALLVPVWDFFGSVKMDSIDQNGQQQSAVIDESFTSHLTINAIDGSIIDRRMGY